MNFRFSQDLDPSGVDVFEETGQCQSGLLNSGPNDQIVQSLLPADQLQGEILRTRIGQELPDSHGWNGAAFVLVHNLPFRMREQAFSVQISLAGSLTVLFTHGILPVR
jgi:hypothetical protein